MKIIPAIDIIEGKCVRLSKGDYSTKKIYNEHPLEVALQFEDAGIQNLHLVDLDGAKVRVAELIHLPPELAADVVDGAVLLVAPVRHLLWRNGYAVTRSEPPCRPHRHREAAGVQVEEPPQQGSQRLGHHRNGRGPRPRGPEGRPGRRPL